MTDQIHLNADSASSVLGYVWILWCATDPCENMQGTHEVLVSDLLIIITRMAEIQCNSVTGALYEIQNTQKTVVSVASLRNTKNARLRCAPSRESKSSF